MLKKIKWILFCIWNIDDIFDMWYDLNEQICYLNVEVFDLQKEIYDMQCVIEEMRFNIDSNE